MSLKKFSRRLGGIGVCAVGGALLLMPWHTTKVENGSPVPVASRSSVPQRAVPAAIARPAGAADLPSEGDIRSAAQALADDAAALRAYCENLPAGAVAERILREAIRELIARDPARAVAFVDLVESKALRLDLRRAIAAEWVQRQPVAAFQWIRGTGEVLLSDERICAAAKAQAVADPMQAMEWLVWSVRSETAMNEAMLAIIGGWVETTPAQAARLVALLPEDETRSTAVAIVARSWMRSDPTTAYIWIKCLPEADNLIAQLPPG
jgi:hypothetical protein